MEYKLVQILQHKRPPGVASAEQEARPYEVKQLQGQSSVSSGTQALSPASSALPA